MTPLIEIARARAQNGKKRTKQMNLPAKDLSISFAVGKSGGSTGQPSDIKRSGRGLRQEQPDPLVLWWVRLLRKENSADQIRGFRESRGLNEPRQQSYRRSRWGQPAEKRLSPISPFFAMHKDGRLLTPSLCALASISIGTFIGLIASLNMVAMAEPALSSGGQRAARANEIPSAERFSMMKDFVGQHNQYLDLSKLNEFKWSDETRVAARAIDRKRLTNRVSARQDSGLSTQPQAVQSTKHRQIKNDAELTGQANAPGRETETSAVAGSQSFCDDQSASQSGDPVILDSQTN